jgi:UDP-N-acetylmuramoyl-tripeptide--D-alanyl-D-alanine ligase
MLELGPETGRMHRDVGQFLGTLGLSQLIVCGTLGRDIAEGARQGGMTCQQIDEVVDATTAADHLKRIVRQGDVVLVKASRGMKMEQVVQALTGMRAVIKQAS